MTEVAVTDREAGHRHAEFHPLRVSEIEPLTEDAVAISFEVPAELADAYEFEAGQHVTIRSPLVGDEVRRNYSICAPAGDGPPAGRREAAQRRGVLPVRRRDAARSATSSR